MIKCARVLFFLLSLPIFSSEVTFEKSVSDLNLGLQNLSARGNSPSNYREYLSLYSQNHSEFLKLRKLWLDVLLNLPSTLSGVEREKVEEFSNNKILQQFSLDEIAYFSYVYEAWVEGNECKTRIAPLVSAMNRVYGSRSLPFLTPRSAVLIAYYLSYPPPAQGRSIHACFKKANMSEGVTFLKVPPLSAKSENGEARALDFDEKLPPGKYRSNETEIEVFNSKVGVGLHVYNFCYSASQGLEGKCFSDLGRQTSARRD